MRKGEFAQGGCRSNPCYSKVDTTTQLYYETSSPRQPALTTCALPTRFAKVKRSPSGPSRHNRITRFITSIMLFIKALLEAIMAAAVSSAAPDKLHNHKTRDTQVPSLDVPACPSIGTISYHNTVPSTDNSAFPITEVALCYDDSFIQITFTALEEENFYCRCPSKQWPTPRFLCNPTQRSCH